MRSVAAALTLALVLTPLSWADAPQVAASVSTTTAVLGQPIVFTDLTSGDGGPFTAAWTDSDGRTTVGHSVTKRFHYAGVHTVILTVSDANGGTVGAIDIPITVLPPTMHGRAYALNAAGGTLADTGEHTTTTQTTERASEGEVANGGFRAAALDAELLTIWDAAGPRTIARADVGLVHIPHPLGFFHITGVEAEAVNGCTMGWRFSDVGKFRFNDAPLVPPGAVAPNTRVDLPDGTTIVLNAQDEPSPDRIAVTAVRILVPGEAPLEIGHAEAGVSHCPWS